MEPFLFVLCVGLLFVVSVFHILSFLFFVLLAATGFSVVVARSVDHEVLNQCVQLWMLLWVGTQQAQRATQAQQYRHARRARQRQRSQAQAQAPPSVARDIAGQPQVDVCGRVWACGGEEENGVPIKKKQGEKYNVVC